LALATYGVYRRHRRIAQSQKGAVDHEDLAVRIHSFRESGGKPPPPPPQPLRGSPARGRGSLAPEFQVPVASLGLTKRISSVLSTKGYGKMKDTEEATACCTSDSSSQANEQRDRAARATSGTALGLRL